FFSSRRRHTRSKRDWSSDVCSSDLVWMESFDCAQDKLRGIQNAGWDPHFAVPILKLRIPHSAFHNPHSAFCCPYSSAEITVRDRSEERRVGKECRTRRARAPATEQN